MALDCFEREIAARVTARETYQQISQNLRQRNPSIRGLSACSVRRFCVSRGIHYRSRMNDQELDVHVALRVQSVGHSYGRKTMQGFLKSPTGWVCGVMVHPLSSTTPSFSISKTVCCSSNITILIHCGNRPRFRKDVETSEVFGGYANLHKMYVIVNVTVL